MRALISGFPNCAAASDASRRALRQPSFLSCFLTRFLPSDIIHCKRGPWQVGLGEITQKNMAVVVKLTVTTPQGIAGGDLVRVAAPDGSYHSIMVPGGLTSGQQFSVELLAVGSAAGASAAETQRLRMELDAERALRRETQQEALRSRTALEALQMKRAQDHAFFRESVKRQRRVME